MNGVAPLPTTPAELAADPRFGDGAWRAPDGDDLYQCLAATYGEPDTELMWRRAEDLYQTAHGEPGAARFGAAS